MVYRGEKITTIWQCECIKSGRIERISPSFYERINYLTQHGIKIGKALASHSFSSVRYLMRVNKCSGIYSNLH